jgi:hypothetical protein
MIEVNGGVVCNVVTTGNAEVYLVDHDNLKENPPDYIYATKPSAPDEIVDELGFSRRLHDTLKDYKRRR